MDFLEQLDSLGSSFNEPNIDSLDHDYLDNLNFIEDKIDFAIEDWIRDNPSEISVNDLLHKLSFLLGIPKTSATLVTHKKMSQ